MVFHEITREAIQRALGETREIDQRLVDAQETRRILDRLYGYEVSPVLWKKVMQGLSAGRVQSVATRLVVERERERMRLRRRGVLGHRSASSTRARSRRGSSRSTASASRRAATSPRRASSSPTISSRSTRQPRASSRPSSTGATFAVRSVDEKPYTRRPAAPFMTSTLQQEASRKLRFSSQTTMRVAQRLYENGYITYMRTDSTTLSESALTAARRQAVELYGADSSPTRRAGTTARSRTRRRRTRRSVRPATRSARRSRSSGELNRRRARALRPDLEAHDRLADGGRARADRLAPARRDDADAAATPSSAPPAP